MNYRLSLQCWQVGVKNIFPVLSLITFIQNPKTKHVRGAGRRPLRIPELRFAPSPPPDGRMGAIIRRQCASVVPEQDAVGTAQLSPSPFFWQSRSPAPANVRSLLALHGGKGHKAPRGTRSHCAPGCEHCPWATPGLSSHHSRDGTDTSEESNLRGTGAWLHAQMLPQTHF